MTEIKDVLDLLGNELKDEGEEQKRFKDFIEKDKWTTEQIKSWIEECLENNSGAHDPYNRAYQDLIVSLGNKLGFEIEYGRYAGRSGMINNDGVWRRANGDKIILEVKTSTWPISSVSQLGDYIDALSKNEPDKNIFGIYVIGKGDIQPLSEQIIGSKYKEKMRLILYGDLLELLSLKDELVPVIGEKLAKEKVQNLLLPIESINIGNVIKLILEIAATKATPTMEIESTCEGEPLGDGNDPWTKNELVPYLKDATPYQRLLLSALAQADTDPTTGKTVTFLMNKISEKRPSENIDKKITGRDIAGARAGLKMRRKNLKKEDIIASSWSPTEREYLYNIKDEYKQIVMEWIKEENLWVKEELGSI